MGRPADARATFTDAPFLRSSAVQRKPYYIVLYYILLIYYIPRLLVPEFEI